MHHRKLRIVRAPSGGTGEIALKILNTSTSQRLLPHSKESLDKSMRKSVYQSLHALNGGQAFLCGNCFETIPPAGMAPCEMLGNSNIECVTRLKSILVDRASTGTSLHDASLGTRGAQCKWLPFSSSCWSRLCPGCKFGLHHLSSIEFSVRIPQWTKAILTSQNGSHSSSGPRTMLPNYCILCEVTT